MIRLWLAGLVTLAACSAPARGARVFPEPQEMQFSGGPFVLDPGVPIVVPAQQSESDMRLARLVSAELTSRYEYAVGIKPMTRVPDHKFILVGALGNPLLKQYCEAHGIELSNTKPGPEGYILQATPEAIVIAGSDEAGAFYGVQSLRQLMQEAPHGGVSVPGVKIRDWPYTAFRGVKLYLPGRDNIPFFKRFVRDYMALYKYNKLIMEMNATMRLDRHPELNAGSLEMARDLLHQRLNEPPALWFHGNNSAHWDTADGGLLEKEEVADLVRWAEANHIEVIPELPTLTHSYYLLTRHRELAEVPQEEWPDTYCPSLQAVYKLVFDVYDEYIEVMHPKMVHIGHDEWRMPWGVCPRCRDKDPRELYAQDVNKIYSYLKTKGIRTAMWSDHLLENVRGAKLSKPWWDAPGYDYKIPGSLSPEQVQKLIPKDILMFNWLWGYTDDPKFPPVTNEERLSEWGFEQIYANFEANLPNFAERTKKSKIVGGAPSAWEATTEFNFGKDLLADFAGCAELVWTGRDRTEEQRAEAVRALMPEIRRNLRPYTRPALEEPAEPLDIHAAAAVPGVEWNGGKAGRGRLVFQLGDKAVVAGGPAIPVGRDVDSLIFLHTLAKPAKPRMGYTSIYDFEDSADLLGWYEVEYEDGLVETIPLRYQWNILDVKNDGRRVAYLADAVDCGKGATFYAFEWNNPRLGKVIKEVRLKGAVILGAVSVVNKPKKPAVKEPPFPK